MQGDGFEEIIGLLLDIAQDFNRKMSIVVKQTYFFTYLFFATILIIL